MLTGSRRLPNIEVFSWRVTVLPFMVGTRKFRRYFSGVWKLGSFVDILGTVYSLKSNFLKKIKF